MTTNNLTATRVPEYTTRFGSLLDYGKSGVEAIDADLLAGSGLESRREVLRTATYRAGAASGHLSTEPSTTLASHSYRIVVRQRAAAVVTEWLVPGRLATAALGGHHAPGQRTSTRQQRRRNLRLGLSRRHADAIGHRRHPDG